MLRQDEHTHAHNGLLTLSLVNNSLTKANNRADTGTQETSLRLEVKHS